MKWSGLTGFTTYYPQIDDYANTWLANGFTEGRDLRDYTDTNEVNASKAAVIAATAKGIKCLWGVCAGEVTITSTAWPNFRAAILSAATWAQANGVFEFQIGNEEEYNLGEVDELFADGFESGDLTAWDDAFTDGGNLSAHADAKHTGNYGLKCITNNGATINVQESLTDVSRYKFRYYINPINIVVNASGDGFANVIGSTGVWAFSFFVNVKKYDTPQWKIMLTCEENDDTDTPTSEYNISNTGWTCIEIDYLAAAGSGYGKLYIDGVLKETISNLTNNERTIGEIEWGFLWGEVDTTGYLSLDDFTSNDGGTNALTLTELIANLKAVATEVKAIFTSGNICYATAEEWIPDWVSAGKGDIDLIGLNAYAEWGEGNPSNWKIRVDALIDAFGVDGTYITEFSLHASGLEYYSEDEAVQAAGITEMIDYIKASGMTRALFYDWKDTPGWIFGVVKLDDTYRLLLNSLMDSVHTASVAVMD